MIILIKLEGLLWQTPWLGLCWRLIIKLIEPQFQDGHCFLFVKVLHSLNLELTNLFYLFSCKKKDWTMKMGSICVRQRWYFTNKQAPFFLIDCSKVATGTAKAVAWHSKEIAAFCNRPTSDVKYSAIDQPLMSNILQETNFWCQILGSMPFFVIPCLLYMLQPVMCNKIQISAVHCANI